MTKVGGGKHTVRPLRDFRVQDTGVVPTKDNVRGGIKTVVLVGVVALVDVFRGTSLKPLCEFQSAEKLMASGYLTVKMASGLQMLSTVAQIPFRMFEKLSADSCLCCVVVARMSRNGSSNAKKTQE